MVELVCAKHPRMAVSEAYRSLRTALHHSSAGSLRTVLGTSATAGEGKTATAGNLAVALAQLGKPVLLIDADLRKPHQHEILKVSNRIGLVNCLVGQVDVAGALVETAYPNLHVVPSGPTPPNPAELLASSRMHDFVAAARERFAYVVIDSPPVLPVTDATILSAVADGVVLCVRSGLVVREDASICLERLLLAEAKILGVVLNRIRLESRRYRRSYYHKYESYLEDSAGSGEAVAAGPTAT